MFVCYLSFCPCFPPFLDALLLWHVQSLDFSFFLSLPFLLSFSTHLPFSPNLCLSVSYVARLKTVDVLMRSLQTAESVVKKYEGRLSEEDSVPADTQAIQALREQLQVRDTHTHTHTHAHTHTLHCYRVPISICVCADHPPLLSFPLSSPPLPSSPLLSLPELISLWCSVPGLWRQSL